MEHFTAPSGSSETPENAEISRREFLKTAGLGLGLLSLSGCALRELRPLLLEPETRPNIVLIMADDLGKEWLSCYGAEGILTPNIDRLARDGIRFDNAYSMAQCTPSRVSLLTGQYPFTHGWVNHWGVPQFGKGCRFDEKYYNAFPRLLQDAGYATAIAGKWQLNDFRIEPESLGAHGFDNWCVWTGRESDNPASEQRYWDPYIHTRSGSNTRYGEYGPDVYCNFLIDFARQNRDRPFFLYYPMCMIHKPFTPTPAEPTVSGKLNKFRAMIRYTDSLIGRLMESLEVIGVRDNTVVIFMTDNGTARNVKGVLNGRAVKGGKATLLEAGVNSPFIVSAPSSPIGIVSDALVDITDIYPTLVDLAGTTVPRSVKVDGNSFAGLIDPTFRHKIEVELGLAITEREWILSMGYGLAKLNEDGRVVNVSNYANRVIRDKRYKLVIIEGDASAFYDLKNDPGEETNILETANTSQIAVKHQLLGILDSLPSKDADREYYPLTL